MKRKLMFVLPLLGLFIICSCGGSKKVVISSESQIKQAFNEGNNALVIELFDSYRDSKKGENIEPALTGMAGQAAFQLANWTKVHQYYSPVADTTSNIEIIGKLGLSYYRMNDEAAEYQYWLKHFNKLENSQYCQTAASRLFNLEIKKENYESALKVWEKIPEKNDPELQFEYITVLEKLKKNKEALKQSADVLQKYPQHEKTLFWRAKHIFVGAENTYQKEMTTYNKNPDYTSYAFLRMELKKISSEFREARDLFEQLHKLKPNSKVYMQYLLNCYIRLEMKNEATKISTLLKQAE